MAQTLKYEVLTSNPGIQKYTHDGQPRESPSVGAEAACSGTRGLGLGSVSHMHVI